MLRRVQTWTLALLAVGLMVSCQNANKDIRDAARENVTNAPVQPATPNSTVQNAAEPAAPTGPTTTVSFAETTFDFGTIDEGEKVSHVYKFTNTGNEPLILSNAKGSCGCTVPSWPREPIAPGEDAEILVEFNSKNKSGKKNQKVTITANTNPPETFIYLTGTVNKDESNPATSPTIQVNN